jgi:hypothetical protein
MANPTRHLTSISTEWRSGPSPCRRFFAAVLCVMLVVGSVFPGVALAGEGDSEGEGTVLPVEIPEPPDFDPGGEETGLEEAPAPDGEESGAVEAQPETDSAAPLPEEVTSAVTEAVPPQLAAVPEPASAGPEPVQQQAPEPTTSEPVANKSIVAPQHKPIKRSAAEPSASSEAAPPTEPVEQEAPSPQPVAATPADSGRNLAGKDSYVVQSGDCLWHIAADLLAGSASTEAVAREVQRLWRLNEDRIGTGDPSLIYAGTELRLR